jgi:hypothetical protein
MAETFRTTLRRPATEIPAATVETTAPAVAPPAPPSPLQKKYEELAKQSAEADKVHNAAEVLRISPLKAAAFKAWKDSEKEAELKEKEKRRLQHR